MGDSHNGPVIDLVTLAGSIATLVEDFCYLRVGVIVEQFIDDLDDFRIGHTILPSLERKWQLQRFCCAAFKSNLQRNILPSSHRHILNQKSDHSLLFTNRGFRVFPKCRKVPGKFEHFFLLRFFQCFRFTPAMLFIVITSSLQLPEFFIPFRLKRIRHQSIFRIDLHKATPGEVSLIFRPLHLLFAQFVGFVKAVLQFFLDLQCHL